MAQVIQTSRGKLSVRLASTPSLAYGELFIAAYGETLGEDYNWVDQNGTKITVVNPGDLFAGSNKANTLFALGSSGSLKFGGVILSTSVLAAELKAAPNTMFMYANDPTVITDGKNSTTHTTLTNGETALNVYSGDLCFYEPASKSYYVLPMSSAQASRTFIDLDIPECASKAFVQDLANSTKGVVTLSDVINGFNKLARCDWNDATKVTSLSSIPGTFYYFEYEEGADDIHLTYGEDGELDLPTGAICIIGSNGEPKVVDLYGGLASAIAGFETSRADAYADSIYQKFPDRVEPTTPAAAITDLYKTKADIDPNTNKIITSQLPDFLLGALKYAGTLNTAEEFLKESATATSVIEALVAADVDGNSDEADSDVAAKTGYYWVYNGETVDITAIVGSIITTNVNVDETAVELKRGDWVVFNGTTFDIIDNTDALQGIKVGVETAHGVVTIEGSKRGETDVDEVKVEYDAATNKVKVSNPNSLLVENEIAENQIVVAGKDNTLKDGGITVGRSTDKKFTITYAPDGTKEATATQALPTMDGTIPTIPAELGLSSLQDYLVKFGADGEVVPTNIEELFNGDTNVGIRLGVTADGEDEALKVNYEDDGTASVTVKDEDGAKQTYIFPTAACHAGTGTEENVHELLDHDSVIDCGVWE